MRCPSCGADNPPQHRFCGQCATTLARPCPRCGQPAGADQRFCGHCGAPLEAADKAAATSEPASEDGAAHVAERRRVSVLFVDLVGFTASSESRDPEEVRDLLSAYFDLCRSIVERYGGVVEKFIGDAVLALWGAPIAHEDDAERAVRCGLELVAAVTGLGLGGQALAARVGVLTGEAAVNLGAVGQGIVAGDLVNTASRLQTAAEAGSVVVGEATYQAARHAIAFAELGEIAVKGKTETVRAYRALRVVAQRKGVGRSDTIEAPFIGRDSELRALKEALDGLNRDGRARLVSVTGIPGIGKSRLAWEFLKYLDGLVEKVYWHQGRSPAYGEGISFWALSEMVRMRAGIAEDADPEVSRAAITTVLDRFVADDDERSWIRPRLLHLLGLADAAPGQREETFAAWRSFFEHIAADAPVVMVFEDLQWADSGLVDFIESILEWSRAHPILIVTLARPELLERRPGWGAGQRSFVSLHLDPLSEEAMRALLDALIRDLPEAFAQGLLDRSEGVPLYAVETVRMLVSNGLLDEHDGAYEVTGELSVLEIPDTLHGLIASRLDALPPDERALVQDAAVLGKSFSLQALAALDTRPSERLTEDLRDLCRRELFSVDNDPRSPERGYYGFVQGLTRDVAYRTLARRDRRDKHLAAARYFESLADDELFGAAAAHFLEAYNASPPGPERDELGALARRSLADAGRRALALGSPEQALAYGEQAVDIAPRGAERAELLELAAQAAESCARYDRAIGCYEEAIAAREELADALGAAATTARWARTVATGRGSFAEAIDRTERAFIAIGEASDVAVRAEVAVTLADLHGRAGEARAAYEWAETALPLVERVGRPELLSGGLIARASALFDLGRHHEAVVLTRGAVSIAESSGLLAEQARALNFLSLFAVDDDPGESLAAARRAVEAAVRIGHRQQETTSLLNVAENSIFCGALESAKEILDELSTRQLTAVHAAWRTACEALVGAFAGEEARSKELLAGLAGSLGESESIDFRVTYLRACSAASWLAGDFGSAWEACAAAVAADPAGINAARALAVGARAALWLRDLGRARTALAAMGAFHGRWMEGTRLTTEAGIAALEGRASDASTLYERALRQWRLLASNFDLALCQLDLARLFPAHPGAEEASAQATEQLRGLGAIALVTGAAGADPAAVVRAGAGSAPSTS